MTAVSTSPDSTTRSATRALEWPRSELDDARRWRQVRIGRLVIDRSFVISNGFTIAATVLLVSSIELVTAASLYVVAAVFLPISSAIHEAGHGLAAKALGYQINYVRFSSTTCAVDWSRPDGKAEPGDVMLVALAGPGANLAVGAMAFALSRVIETSPWLSAIVLISVLQGVLNLVPRRSGSDPHPATDGGLPSDGYIVVWSRRALALAE